MFFLKDFYEDTKQRGIALFLFFTFFFLNNCSRFSRASTQYDLQTKQDKITAWAYFYQGLRFEYKKNWRQASENFYKSSILETKNSRIYMHLAKSLFFLNAKNSAFSALKKAEKYAHKNDYLLFFDIGRIYHLGGNYERAKYFYKKSTHIFPRFQKAVKALAVLSSLTSKGKLCQ